MNLKYFLACFLTAFLACPNFAAPPYLTMMSNGSRSTLAAGSGTPAGNVFTDQTGSPYTVGNSNTASPPAGASGDIEVALLTWESTGTVSSIDAGVFGTMTLGTADAGTGVNSVMGKILANSTSAVNLTPTVSGSCTFRDWMVIRASASGTITVGTPVMAHGTGTAISVGPYTTACQNGYLLAIVKVDGSTTTGTPQFGGINGTVQTIAGTSTFGVVYKHTAVQTAANFTTTLGTSRNWTVQVVDITAQ